MTTRKQGVAIDLLGRLLTGLDDVGVDLETEGDAVHAAITLPSGDVYRVSVAWDSEASP